MKYVKKDFQRCNTSNLNSQTTAKRSARISTGMFDRKTDCFFCGNKVIINYKKPEENEYCCVSTFGFVDKIINHCKTRSDEWASSVQGRIEYFGGELHAADSLYHHCCDVNFHTGRDLWMQYRADSGAKRKKAGRQSILTRNEHFKRCATTSKKIIKNNSQLPILLKKCRNISKMQIPSPMVSSIWKSNHRSCRQIIKKWDQNYHWARICIHRRMSLL